MEIRAFKPEDCKAMRRLFYETVHAVNAADYTKEQLDAWTSGQESEAEWTESFLKNTTLVALMENQLVGFADMEKGGYLNRLYVHKDFQGRSVASALCDRLEQEADAQIITTHASVTAKTFFEKRGYKLVRQQQVQRRGVLLTNFVMELQKSGKIQAMAASMAPDERYVEDAVFTNETAENLNFSKGEFVRVSFSGCVFRSCDFTKGSFYNVVFEKCSFENCRFMGSYWKGCTLAGSKADGGDFREAHIKESIFSESVLRYANFTEAFLDKTVMRNCNLKEAAFSAVRLAKPEWENIDFSRTEFFGTKLKGVDLSSCNIEGIVVSESCSELKGAKIDVFQAAEIARILGIEIV